MLSLRLRASAHQLPFCALWQQTIIGSWLMRRVCISSARTAGGVMDGGGGLSNHFTNSLMFISLNPSNKQWMVKTINAPANRVRENVGVHLCSKIIKCVEIRVINRSTIVKQKSFNLHRVMKYTMHISEGATLIHNHSYFTSQVAHLLVRGGWHIKWNCNLNK